MHNKDTQNEETIRCRSCTIRYDRATGKRIGIVRTGEWEDVPMSVLLRAYGLDNIPKLYRQMEADRLAAEAKQLDTKEAQCD